MRAWEDYGSCCRAVAARDPAATFCPDCGHLLLRCPSPGCGSLVTPLGHCTACVDLGLSLEERAVLAARSGECLSVPFVLKNNSRGRSLSIRSVVRDVTNLPQAAVPITWDRLDAGRERALAVEAGPFPSGGIYGLRLTIVVGAGFDEAEESYAFSGDVSVDVEGPDPTHVTYDMRGAASGTGGMVYAPTQQAVESRRRRAEALGSRTRVPLERAERYEIEQGHRGYGKIAARIPRNADFSYQGFPEKDRPPDGPWIGAPVIRCGRNGRVSTSQPNDLCLRIYDPASGELDREASTAIPRRLCDLVLRNDRLYLRSACDSGPALNGEPMKAGETRTAGNGDSFAVLAGHGRRLAVGIAFKVSAGVVSRVRLEKES